MIRKYLLPTLAIIGSCFALVIVFWSQRQVPTAPILFPPATSPYVHAIAGSGIIEASSRNISIGSPFSEIVTDIFVVEGDRVHAGDLLFQLDLRAFQAQADKAQASIDAALMVLKDKETQFSFYSRLKDKRAVSEQAYQQAFYAVKEAEENVKVSQAVLKEIETNIERSMIRAPVDGEILQVNVFRGEIAPVVAYISSQATLILMGTVDPLQVRIDIDEEDAWKFRKGAPATAFVRGNSAIHFPLRYVRIEPYIVPKSSFTGDTTERVDTRVLQVLYEFEKGELPVYAGQILDIFIETEANTNYEK